jgi:hypothetical protein
MESGAGTARLNRREHRSEISVVQALPICPAGWQMLLSLRAQRLTAVLHRSRPGAFCSDQHRVND